MSKKKFLHQILLSKKRKYIYPLLDQGLSPKDLNEGIKVLKSGRITMGKKTQNFENKFNKFIGSKYALMVNSGSSANLLAFFALINPLKKKRLNYGDECLIPSLCWSTSLWPIVQSGLKPKFIDIDTKTLNAPIDQIKKNITKKTRAIMAVHVLGNSTKMDELKKITKKRKIYLIEDTCESLGSKYRKKHLGTFGDFGTYSFYYSHQITSGEGGMIVCNDKKNYEIIHSLRAHGWCRELPKNNKLYKFKGNEFEDSNDIRRAFRKIPTTSDAVLIETKNGIEVKPNDVGSGITQVFPIIVACVHHEHSILAIEQPELHIHPRIQQQIAL